MSRIRLVLAILSAVVLTGCGGAQGAQDGRSTEYMPGVPDFDLDVVLLPSPEATTVQALVSIPHASLVFVSEGDGFRASVRTSLVLETRDGRLLASPAVVDTVRLRSFRETLGFIPLMVEVMLEAEPGPLLLKADVEDIQTGRIASRHLTFSVPDPEDSPSLSAPRLSGRAQGEAEFIPLVALAVPSSLDSLRARVDVLGQTESVAFTAILLRLRADSTAAPSPTMFTPGRASLRARGVDARTVDTVAVSRQVVDRPAPRLTAEVPLPTLRPGVYRLDIEAEDAGKSLGSTSRTFVVRPDGFPRLVGLRALIEPLAYIATPREREALQSASPDSLRDVFDAFWGRLFSNRSLAAATLDAYYERVEEANRLFSGHSEGWKTDRGMIYILFGPPERVEDRFDSEVWIYTQAQSAGSFVFERTARRAIAQAPFDVWTLTRDRAYDASWRRVIRLWRSGDIP